MAPMRTCFMVSIVRDYHPAVDKGTAAKVTPLPTRRTILRRATLLSCPYWVDCVDCVLPCPRAAPFYPVLPFCLALTVLTVLAVYCLLFSLFTRLWRVASAMVVLSRSWASMLRWAPATPPASKQKASAHHPPPPFHNAKRIWRTFICTSSPRISGCT